MQDEHGQDLPDSEDLAPDAFELGDTTVPPEFEDLITDDPNLIVPDNVDKEG